jgi:hypothetical protein
MAGKIMKQENPENERMFRDKYHVFSGKSLISVPVI